MLSFFPRDVLDEILNLTESVSEDFPSYFFVPVRQSLLFFSGTRNSVFPLGGDSSHKTIKVTSVVCHHPAVIKMRLMFGVGRHTITKFMKTTKGIMEILL